MPDDVRPTTRLNSYERGRVASLAKTEDSISPGQRYMLFSLLLCGVFISPARGQWQGVGTGIAYREFNVAGPNKVFVTRMDRSSSDVHIESSIARGRLSGGRETVSSMAARYDDAIGYWNQTWGTRNDVVVAVNGDFFNLTTGVPTSGQIHSGWYAKRFSDYTGGSGMAFQLDGDVFIGGCVQHRSYKNFVRYPATGQQQHISGINVAPDAHKLTLYTPQYDTHTDALTTVSEVVVRLDEPLLIKPTPANVSGIVQDIRPSQGGTLIPFDSVVLSADGNAAGQLLNNVSLGSEVRISQEITDLEDGCTTISPLDWTKTYASIGGSFHFLDDGAVQSSSDPGATQRHPRTAVAYNDSYIYFVVVDGRSTASVGMSMSMTELGNFCLNDLDAVEGMNQDGGGSSAMWVNGRIKNNPSDGTERAVANGLMMVVAQPKQQSSQFFPGDEVTTLADANVRLGPGLNYAAIAFVSASADATIVEHPLNGVRGTGASWWKCRFAGSTGWVDGLDLRLVGARVPDFDEDDDVDLDDYGRFQACLTGSLQPAPPECQSARLDGDSDVDENDLILFMRCMSGPDVAADPDCAAESGTIR